MLNGAPEQPQTSLFPNVLLCISSNAETQNLLLAEKLYGKPLLFHQIRKLQTAGAERFYIVVDAVSGALIALGDELRSLGISIEFLRTPADLANKAQQTPCIMLYSADILADNALITSLATKNTNTILVVEELEGNQDFERIDLNSRWGGLALIEQRTLSAVSSMPEGWDVASTLLRQSLQDRATPLMVRQSDVFAGKLKHLKNVADIERSLSVNRGTNGWVEGLLFKPLRTLVTRLAWEKSWSRDAFCLAFPTLALLTAILAGFDFPLPALIIAFLTVIASEARSFVLKAECRKTKFDFVAGIAWLLLSLALATGLHADGNTPFDAIFLSLTLSVLVLLSARGQRISYASPLILILMFLLGELSGTVTVSIKIAIAAQLMLLTIGNWAYRPAQD